MMRRCYYPGAVNYKLYGARGITVDERWRGVGGFAAFVANMGMPPASGMTIDRVDNEGPYSPANCKWVSRRAQSLNSRSTIWITVDGVTQCFTEWARHVGANNASLRHRAKSFGGYEAAIRSYATYPNGRLRRLPKAAKAALKAALR
jgi:hypothetical protein